MLFLDLDFTCSAYVMQTVKYSVVFQTLEGMPVTEVVCRRLTGNCIYLAKMQTRIGVGLRMSFLVGLGINIPSNRSGLSPLRGFVPPS